MKGRDHVGLICDSCGGLGQAEPKTERINKRMQPVLRMYIVVILLLGILAGAIIQTRFFSEILAFSGPLIGMVITWDYADRTKR